MYTKDVEAAHHIPAYWEHEDLVERRRRCGLAPYFRGSEG